MHIHLTRNGDTAHEISLAERRHDLSPILVIVFESLGKSPSSMKKRTKMENITGLSTTGFGLALDRTLSRQNWIIRLNGGSMTRRKPAFLDIFRPFFSMNEGL